jgi:hypothetical protein
MTLEVLVERQRDIDRRRGSNAPQAESIVATPS